MSPTLSAIEAHIERCPRCTSTKRCSEATRMFQAWQLALVSRMEPRSAVKA